MPGGCPHFVSFICTAVKLVLESAVENLKRTTVILFHVLALCRTQPVLYRVKSNTVRVSSWWWRSPSAVDLQWKAGRTSPPSSYWWDSWWRRRCMTRPPCLLEKPGAPLEWWRWWTGLAEGLAADNTTTHLVTTTTLEAVNNYNNSKKLQSLIQNKDKKPCCF